MEELRLMVPTYVGNLPAEQRGASDDPDFSDPHIPVVVRDAAGIRIVLGSHDYDALNMPDVQIERRPNGWAIFLHPLGGSDASAYVYFLDDGRSFLVPEDAASPTIKVIDHLEDIPELDMPAANVALANMGRQIPQVVVEDFGEETSEIQRFRFEVGASVGFVVEAESEEEAREKAEKIREQLFWQEPTLKFPAEHDLYLAVDESAPDLMEVESEEKDDDDEDA
jgi:hypothetical protein